MIILDNFLGKDQLEIFSDKKLWRKLSSNWLDISEKPKDIWGLLASQIWNTPCFSKYLKVDKYVGIEYWVNINSENNELSWHRDRDEVLFTKTGEHSPPKIGCVYYGNNDDVKGGYLEIKHNNNNIERIEPRSNRLVIFDSGGLWHRVSPIQSGVRYAFASNIFDYKIAIS